MGFNPRYKITSDKMADASKPTLVTVIVGYPARPVNPKPENLVIRGKTGVVREERSGFTKPTKPTKITKRKERDHEEPISASSRR